MKRLILSLTFLITFFPITKVLAATSREQNNKRRLELALAFAISTNDINKVKNLLAKGVDVNTRIKTEPFFAEEIPSSAENEIINTVLSKETDPKEIGRFTTISLLHLAAHKGNENIIKLLLDKGIDVNVKDEQGNTPLFYAFITSNNLDTY